jgi:hypothetical protein
MDFQHVHLVLLGFTKTADKRWLGERVDLLSIGVLLNIRGNVTAETGKTCSHGRSFTSNTTW